MSEITWNASKIFDCSDNCKYAIVILNQPINLPKDYVISLWEKAEVTVTVDGGTNHWLNYLEDQANDVLTGKSTKYLPTLVTGDMDSILPKILEKLKSTKTKIIVTPDVMETDYTKAIRELQNYISTNHIELDRIHVLSESRGRFDQIISNINTLYKCDKIVSKLTVIQMASNSLTWLLRPGRHKIIIPEIILQNKSWCALIPFGESNSRVTTEGLKWNLHNKCMRFGELISTSNTYSGQPVVTIITDSFLIWSMGIEALTLVEEL